MTEPSSAATAAALPSSPSRRGREALLLVAVAAVTAALAWPVYRQGINLLDDGVWLLGARDLLDGKLLYRDFFTIYGPARFVGLAAFFVIFGSSAATLALLESLILGAMAALGFGFARVQGAGRWAWLVPVALLAVGPLKLKVLALGVLALVCARLLGRWKAADGRRTAIVLAAATGLVSCFGFDAFLQSLLVVAGTLAWTRVRMTRAQLLSFVGVLAALLALPWAIAAATSSLSTALWDTVVYPALHFRHEMGVPLWQTLADLELLGRPFLAANTGETPGGPLPLHASWRAAGMILLAMGLLAAPLCFGRSREPRWTALRFFAAASLLPLVGRGDVSHLLGAAPAAIWILPVALARIPKRGARIALIALFGFALAPPLAEHLWSLTHTGRLESYERPRAKIALAAERIASLDRIAGELPGSEHEATLFWPAQPGLNFLFDLPHPIAQVTLLGGEVRDPATLVDELERSRVRRVVLAEKWKLRGRTTRELCPPAWEFFRQNYRVVANVDDVTDPYQVLEYVSGGRKAILGLPLQARLFDRRQNVANATSPNLSEGRRVGQVLEVSDLDLSGLRVRWGAAAAGITVPVEILLWDYEEGLGRPFQGYRSEVVFEGRDKVSEFLFDPPPPTAGRRIAVTIEVTSKGLPATHLLWHEGDDDLYSEGSALVDEREVEADLYFTTY